MTRNLPRFIIIIAAMLIELSTAAQVKDISLSAGLQWIPSVADVSNAFGTPVAFAYRTKARTSRERVYAGAMGSSDVISRDFGYGNEYGDAGNVAAEKYLLANADKLLRE